MLDVTLAEIWLQKAQSKKGKKAEKSPQDESPPSLPSNNNAVELDNKIKQQGEKIRKLKADKADKVNIYQVD